MSLRRERIDRGIQVRSNDVYALNSWREMLYLMGPRVFPVAALVLLGAVSGEYWQRVMVSASMFALLAISWDLLNSAGMVSLGQSLFFGIGAYIAGVLNHYFGLSPWLTVPLATVGGGLLSHPDSPAGA